MCDSIPCHSCPAKSDRLLATVESGRHFKIHKTVAAE
jgi:hypothetical protein